jgi:hypothetical protein
MAVAARLMRWSWRQRRALLLATALGAGGAADWTGTITVEESLVGPAAVGGSDRVELEDYARLLRDRLQKAQQEVHTAPLTVRRILLEDIGTYQAELERIVIASGKAIQVGTSVFTIKGARMRVTGDGPRLIVDRPRGQELLYVGGRIEPVALAPLPPLREIEKDAQDVQLQGVAGKRFTMRAEGKTLTVVLAPGLPNLYAIGLLSGAPDEKDSIAANLATLPGLPLLVEYRSDEVTHRWQVGIIAPGPVDEAIFGE